MFNKNDNFYYTRVLYTFKTFFLILKWGKIEYNLFFTANI